MQAWNGLIWLTKGIVTGCHEHGNEPSGFKEVRNPLTRKKLVPSQVILYSMYLVN